MTNAEMITVIEKQITELMEKLKELKNGDIVNNDDNKESKISKKSKDSEDKAKNVTSNNEPGLIQIDIVGVSTTDPTINLSKIEIKQDYAKHLEKEVSIQRSLEEKIKPLILSVSGSRIARESSVGFNIKQLCRTISDVPRFFSCVSIHGVNHCEKGIISGLSGIEPNYLPASVQAFQFSTAEVRVRFESEGLDRKISFDPFQVSQISKIEGHRLSVLLEHNRVV